MTELYIEYEVSLGYTLRDLLIRDRRYWVKNKEKGKSLFIHKLNYLPKYLLGGG